MLVSEDDTKLYQLKPNLRAVNTMRIIQFELLKDRSIAVNWIAESEARVSSGNGPFGTIGRQSTIYFDYKSDLEMEML